MVAVGSGEVGEVGTVLAEEGVRGEVGAETACGDDHRSHLLESLPSTVGALDATNAAVSIGEKLVYLRLQQDPRLVRFLSDLLELLHEPVSYGHAGETLFATVRPGHGMATEARNEAE